MSLSIHFSHPWLLMALIPAAAIILIPHFTLKKKYRRTRNRITAIVLEGIVLTLAVLMLAGLTFIKTTNNKQNQIILLVDVSDTQKQAEDTRDSFVAKVLDNAENEGYQVGIVTFGFTQEYAVPVTDDVGEVYQRYLSADKPDTSATDIAAALNYTKDLFTSDSAKIVLITDGKETDESASTVIKAISAQGICVDVAYIPSSYGENEIQLTGIEFPDYHVNLNEQCPVTLSVQSSKAASAAIELYDNGEKITDGGEEYNLTEGTQKITFTHSFTEKGLHELTFNLTVTDEDDSIKGNNVYSTYLNLEIFNKILIIESTSGQSLKLETLLGGSGYEVTTLNIEDKVSFPSTIDELRKYDQVILNNIAYSDFREDNPDYGTVADAKPDIYPFADLLYSYVYDYGGGLLTTGGSDTGEVAHAYNRQDLYGTTLQELLPVQAVKYTPPLGLVLIIDRSGSMAGEYMDGKSYLDWARSGAVTCLDNMTERDYLGVLTLDTDFNTILPMTPCTQQAKIRTAINGIDTAYGGTSYPGAIDRAGRMLKALENVDKRHIILISDGQVPASEKEAYEKAIKSFYDSDKITFSIVGIGIPAGSATALNMKDAADLGHGRVIAISKDDNFIAKIKDELNVKEIKEVNFEEPFAPLISNMLSPLLKGVERGEEGEAARHMTVTLGGFYGVKAKSSADVILSTDYGAPIYAQWKFGNGMVGSFMCDVYSDWSDEFLKDANGSQFISNLVFNLMPLDNIRPNGIRAEIKGENYLNQMSVFTDLPSGSYLRGKIEYTTSKENTTSKETVSVSMNEVTADVKNKPCYVTTPLSEANNYTRCNFVIRKNGVYKITITKYDSSDAIVEEYVTYREFSYSKEYDVNVAVDEQVMKNTLTALAENGDGKLIADNEAPWEIFEDFVAVYKKIYDPVLLFAILVMVLFLLCIAVRKFKFKWPHELIREYRAKKRNEKK